MYQALYRKYRPQSFGDVCGQEHITKTLINQIKNQSISHAYLFTGPRGTGKTSCAKILAKAVNCLDNKSGDACLKCDACLLSANEENLDITEIDAASNNGVDNIRDLRNSVNYTPANGKYRVYIIDEVHMLSPGAFNALLKTLEEPPAHVIFILATTEVHKLPATIISRCQRFDFKRLDPSVIVDRLNEVSSKEGITLEPSAAALLAALCDGGMRDALSMLDLCAAYSTNITDEVVQTSCAIASKERLFELVDSLLLCNASKAIRIADGLYKDSVDMQRLCEELIAHFRNLLLLASVKEVNGLIVCTEKDLASYKEQSEKFAVEQIMFAIKLLGDTLTRMNSSNRKTELEMALIKLCDPALCHQESALAARISALEKKLEKGTVSLTESAPAQIKAPVISETEKASIPEKNKEETLEDTFESSFENDEIPLPEFEPAQEPVYENPAPAAAPSGELAEWQDILKELSKSCPLLVGVLKGSRAFAEGDTLLIDYSNDQFSRLVKQPLYRDYIRKAALDVLGKNYKLGPYKAPGSGNKVDLLDALTGKLSGLGIQQNTNETE